MLVGAIVGWGILSPVAKHKGWAPGPVNDWDNGSRGWIVWVGMGLILGDSAIGLFGLSSSLVYHGRAANLEHITLKGLAVRIWTNGLHY